MRQSQTDRLSHVRHCAALAAVFLGLGVWCVACGSVPPAEDNPEHQVKPSLVNAVHLNQSVEVVDCTLENGSQAKCYKFQFRSNPLGHGGPYCPKTTKETGGLGIYDGKTNPGLQALKAVLWDAMKADGFDVVDENGNINIVDPGAGGMGGPPNGGQSSGGSNDGPPGGGPGGGPPPNGGPPGGGQPGGGSQGGSGGGPGAACLEASPNDQLVLTFLIPANPVMLSTPNKIDTVELVGLSVNGIPINGHPPTVAGTESGGPGGGGAIPALDPCGGHMDPAGYYHWHFGASEMNSVLKANNIHDVTCTAVAQSQTAMIGYAKDGHPIYASKDQDGSAPSNLDSCQGHTAPTKEFPNGVYHYHVSDNGAPNLPPCLKGAAAQNPFQRQ